MLTNCLALQRIFDAAIVQGYTRVCKTHRYKVSKNMELAGLINLKKFLEAYIHMK
jgi:hypothetical protein